MHRTPRLALLILGFTLALAACGQKGDLYLPAKDARAALTTDIGR